MRPGSHYYLFTGGDIGPQKGRAWGFCLWWLSLIYFLLITFLWLLFTTLRSAKEMRPRSICPFIIMRANAGTLKTQQTFFGFLTAIRMFRFPGFARKRLFKWGFAGPSMSHSRPWLSTWDSALSLQTAKHGIQAKKSSSEQASSLMLSATSSIAGGSEGSKFRAFCIAEASRRFSRRTRWTSSRTLRSWENGAISLLSKELLCWEKSTT